MRRVFVKKVVRRGGVSATDREPVLLRVQGSTTWRLLSGEGSTAGPEDAVLNRCPPNAEQGAEGRRWETEGGVGGWGGKDRRPEGPRAGWHGQWPSVPWGGGLGRRQRLGTCRV